MLGWFKALMPKEERFFALFVKHATIVVAGAEALRSVLKGGDDVERYCRIVSERENEADEVTREVLLAVRRSNNVKIEAIKLDKGNLTSSVTVAPDMPNRMTCAFVLVDRAGVTTVNGAPPGR